MNQQLNKNQIDYILFHLSFFIDLTELRKLFVFSGNRTEKPANKKVFFLMSSESLNDEKILYFDDIPILFPIEEVNKPYELTDGCLIFRHDLLKSSFYLLSGYQEFISDASDCLCRFPFKNSIQKRLDIIEKPVVNYYFEWIISGLKEFCTFHNLLFTEKKPLKEGAFILSHDVDRIVKYDFYETSHKLMELFGLKPSNFSRLKLIKLIPKYILKYFFLPGKFDPYWNFKKLRDIEISLNIKSTWYFLEKQDKHDNSRYYFNNRRIRQLMQFLIDGNCEIGLHATVRSATDLYSMIATLHNLKNNVNYSVTGNRQHKLIFKTPTTFKIQQASGLKYDHTLTFAEHEGYRNSFCFPFKPYDFENDQMIDIWEIPLIVMDGTLFYYRKLSFEEIEQQVDLLVTETMKFSGAFSLLWHNSHFDEDEFPGIGIFYKRILQRITARGIIPMTAIESLEKFKA